MMLRLRVAHRSSGFTLLEMMLVVFIVGIIAALAMPNLVTRDDKQVMEESAEELLAFIQLQEEEAILTGSQRGLQFFQRVENGSTSYHYQWLVWLPDETRWEEAPGKMRQLNGEIAAVGNIALAVDGRPVEIGQELDPRKKKATLKKDDKGPQPQAIVFSSGEYTDFELTMTSIDGDLTLILSGGYAGIALQDEAEMESKK